MGALIVANNLVKEYKHIKAVNNISIEVKAGRFYAIMGRSGSGKTTLLSLLGMLDNPTSGELYINGSNALTLKDEEKSDIRMKEFGFVFQDFHLNPVLKAYENVMIPMHINPEYRKLNIQEKSIELLELFGLKERYNHFPAQLSGGEQQRVALARALANNPMCVFADEPTGNLDIESEKIVFDYLKMLTKKGKSIVVVSHNEIVLDYADEVFYMTEGTLKEKQYEIKL